MISSSPGRQIHGQGRKKISVGQDNQSLHQRHWNTMKDKTSGELANVFHWLSILILLPWIHKLKAWLSSTGRSKEWQPGVKALRYLVWTQSSGHNRTLSRIQDILGGFGQFKGVHQAVFGKFFPNSNVRNFMKQLDWTSISTNIIPADKSQPFCTHLRDNSSFKFLSCCSQKSEKHIFTSDGLLEISSCVRITQNWLERVMSSHVMSCLVSTLVS